MNRTPMIKAMTTAGVTVGAVMMTATVTTPSPTFADTPPRPAPAEAASDIAADRDAAPAVPRIEVAFVLDTTGSMGGLIEGAKQKIWAITNQIAAADPTPELRLGLIGYRDRGDAYVTQVHDLTDDLDAIYGHLTSFQAGGGGDTPESVNQALHEAVHKLSWSDDRDVLKIIFLVGDAPPHMDYEQDVPYTETCRLAVERDLIINTIQCGGMTQTTPIWQEIARRAEGSYVAIGQTGDVQIVETPMDEELARLNRELNATVLAYGEAPQQAAVRRKLGASEVAAAPAAADRVSYFAEAREGEVISGRGDLVADLAKEEIDAEALATMEADALPEPMREMSPEERLAYVKEQAERREALQAKIAEVAKQRAAYLAEQRRKQAEDGTRDGFDAQVTEMIQSQAARKGIRYEQAAE